MSIITISRGSFSRGKEVAERVAKKLGYVCISRDILLETSEKFNVPEIKLIRAIHDSPSLLDHVSYGKEAYVAYIQAALLKYLRKDNIVYHGLAGHFFVKDIPHVLKVRIISDFEDRINFEMQREKISRKEAVRILKNDDEQRRKWSLSLYGIDTSDSGLYDLVIHIKKITVDDAADIICHTINQKSFETTPSSQKAINDLALAAEIKIALIDLNIDVEVISNDGKVNIKVKSRYHGTTIISELTEIVKNIKGVKEVNIESRHLTIYSE
ncbi:MAG: cytidylate kinase-like family protein [Desulfobacterales bacterium]|nr:cytidylate kinase-like family protein [Desulfobacterales bacterium]